MKRLQNSGLRMLGKRSRRQLHETHGLLFRSGKKAFPDSTRYTLVSDPDRKIYAAWGVGSLGWTGMVNSDIMGALKSLKESDGIDMRPTGAGSYRWQNSGGFAVDGKGKIRWLKIAKDSSDVCDYAAAAGTILDGKGSSQTQSRL
jgi:hypothetical protein